MAEGQALRDTKLSSIMIVGFGKLVLGKNAFKLREHVGRVDYGVNDVPPHWDDLLNGGSALRPYVRQPATAY